MFLRFLLVLHEHKRVPLQNHFLVRRPALHQHSLDIDGHQKVLMESSFIPNAMLGKILLNSNSTLVKAALPIVDINLSTVNNFLVEASNGVPLRLGLLVDHFLVDVEHILIENAVVVHRNEVTFIGAGYKGHWLVDLHHLSIKGLHIRHPALGGVHVKSFFVSAKFPYANLKLFYLFEVQHVPHDYYR